MDTSNRPLTNDNTTLKVITNQPSQKNTTDSKKNRSYLPKPSLTQQISRATIPLSSGLRILNTKIQAKQSEDYHPLVTISDKEDTNSDDDYISPVHKLTKNELREELNGFVNGDNNIPSDDEDLELRQPQQPTSFLFKCCTFCTHKTDSSKCIIS
ncbi:unnamed protein product [Didymodactylos carnosus]|uniref:Uncharacterized protein n=1 Tax=Didymodactylos carnosus TaxID=1234261 RepID=A0A813Y491_9BILA|nr:unnamed protein product [Didymodactylos carnosus]CAF0927134.1 unnamed protein product [Didymodactylos carnosus]CAF3664776.1 unnamed protein product [Didymodactylos carnosus]CAF3704073.1 unnamed protein product [Didymodactylos carnosus]